jgi:xanthine dehydrogenase YagR molybdenum-binding subunit
MLGVRKEQVRVISKFLGSGFGGKGAPWPHSALAAAAARDLNRPVKLVVGRQESFQTTGHRPPTRQRIRLGARADGKLTSLRQDYVNRTSILDNYKEDCGEATPYHYAVANLRMTAGRAKRNVGTPTSMRGPGAVPGLYATEAAMDELAIRLNMDPIQLRLLNEPEFDQGLNVPFSSRHLRECFSLGADRFGWSKRIREVGSMKRDGLTLGWGVAGCSWIAQRSPCDATVELRDDGWACVSCGVQDIGTGTYTVLAQIVSDKVGIPIDRVEVVLGDSALPAGPTSGGSMLTASVYPAVTEAAEKAIQTLLATAAQMPRSGDELAYSQGRVHSKEAGAETGIAYEAVLKQAQVRSVSGKGSSAGTWGEKKFSKHCYGAHFIEVTWQEEIARLRVSRVVTVIDAGRIINPSAARNQIEGAVVMGIGMGLFEETSHDARSGQPLNNNLADYLVATHADVPALEVHFLHYPDTQVNSLGAKGIGEIGLAGVAAALTSAVHHATGVRVRELPIRIENLLRTV